MNTILPIAIRDVIASLVVLLAVISVSTAARADTKSLLHEAEVMAARDQKDGALDAYAEVLKSRPDLAAVHYNVGTLHLEEGNVGAATVALLRALYHDPTLEDAQFQLDAITSGRAELQIGAGPGRSLLRRVGAMLSPGAISLLFFGALLLLCMAILIGAAVSFRGRRVVLASTSALFVVATLLIVARMAAEGTPVWVLTAESASAQKAPQADAATSFEAYAGLYGEQVERRDGYLRLRLENGVDAWFPEAGFVQATPPPTP